jgi:acetyl esterase/lipase
LPAPTQHGVQAAEPSANPASSENPTATHPVEKDLNYKNTPQGELTLVVTLPPDAKPGDRRPAIVFFSGGAWANSNINQFKGIAPYLARRGMVAVRVDYRAFKTHNVGPDKCVEDARTAVRWVREHARQFIATPRKWRQCIRGVFFAKHMPSRPVNSGLVHHSEKGSHRDRGCT